MALLRAMWRPVLLVAALAVGPVWADEQRAGDQASRSGFQTAYRAQDEYASQVRLANLNAFAGDAMKRVVTLLNDLKIRIEEEGRTEKDLFDAFMCWCKSGFKEKEEAIEATKDVILTLHPRIQDAKTQVALLETKLETLNGELADGKQALSTSIEIRKKERVANEEEITSLKTSSSSLDKAIAVLEKKAEISLTQLQSAANLVEGALLPFAQSEPLVKQCLEDDRLQDFLRGGRAGGTAAAALLQGPSAGFSQLIGMLKQMRDNFNADLQEVQQTEQQAQAANEALVESKTAEISTLVEQIQQMTEEKSTLAIQLTRDEHDLIDAQKTLAEDQEFFEDMKSQCGTKEQEWQERSEMRLRELTAINKAADLLMEDEEVVTFNKVMKVTPKDVPTEGGALVQSVAPAPAHSVEAASAAPPELLGPGPGNEVPVAFIQSGGVPATLVTANPSGPQYVEGIATTLDMGTPISFLQVRRASDITFMAPRPMQSTASLEQLMGIVQTHLRADPQNKQLGLLASRVQSLMNGGMSQDNFAAIIAMIQQTLKILVMEADEDVKHQKWCEEEIAANTKELKDQKATQDQLEMQVTAVKTQLEDANKEMKTLRDDITLINEQRSDSQKMRLKEQKEYDGTLVELKEAQQALYKAIVVLKEVYGSTPALVQRAAATSQVGQGGSVPPAPDTWTDKYEGQDGGRNIVQMLAEIGEDLVRQEEESKKEEEESKAEYEKNMADFEEDSRLKQEQLVSRSGIAAKLELTLENAEDDLDQLEETLESLGKQQLDLHTSCDFILKNFLERKRQREAEVANMKEAIAILKAER